MKIIKYPVREEWPEILERPAHDLKQVNKIVKPILKKVQRKGDKALKKYALEHDHADLKDLYVTRDEIRNAEKKVGKELKEAIALASANIEKFHLAQRDQPFQIETIPGVVCSRKSVPMSRVGLYVPGGTAPLFSTVLMLGIPANIAGCEEIILCTPPDHRGHINPVILYTANSIGIDKIFKVGGAQAVAAMAFGTETVPKVDKIFGPGNQYVMAAKQIVSRKHVAIDMPAGPSEVLVYADETANPEFVAADLLSQAEHGIDSQVILITEEENMLHAVVNEVKVQLEKLPRKDIARRSIDASLALLIKSKVDAIDLINEYAPEHLILSVKDAARVADSIINAGSIFIGNFSPESVGDYASGTNHTLPTNGWARSYAGVSVDSFVKKITYQHLSEEGLKNIGHSVEIMAEAEKLIGHRNAVSIRLKYLKDRAQS